MTTLAPDAVALLTGASGGLGAHIARALGAAGARLVLTGRDEVRLGQLRDELQSTRIACEAIRADLADPAEVGTLLDRATAEFGHLDVLVHNAAIESCSRFDRLEGGELADTIQVNLTAPLELTRRALPAMVEQGRGHVVFVSSISGFAGTAYLAAYAATKGALNAVVPSLRAEFADTPVEFSLVAPGSVEGDGMFARAMENGTKPPRALRLVKPEAVARAVVSAIEHDTAQTVVAGGPIRPALALGLLSPRRAERLSRRLGVDELFRPAAEARGRA